MSITIQVFLLAFALGSLLIGLQLLLRPDPKHANTLSRFTDLRNGISCILCALLLLVVVGVFKG